jgi:hypothetical protein
VKKRNLYKKVVLTTFFLSLVSSLTFAADRDIVKFQGIIMEINFSKKLMVVNEKQLVWNQATAMNNEKGSPTSFDKLKPKSWVYVEGVENKLDKRIIANRIYLLPKYIDGKERHLYPFIK